MGWMEKIFGDLNAKEVKKLEKIADLVVAREAECEALDDDALRAKTAAFRERLAGGQSHFIARNKQIDR
jgi:preprotein translocase subunit SecA